MYDNNNATFLGNFPLSTRTQTRQKNMSIITKRLQIRYCGLLKNLNPLVPSITLHDVIVFGTENRVSSNKRTRNPQAQFVPAAYQLHGEIEFNADEVESCTVDNDDLANSSFLSDVAIINRCSNLNGIDKPKKWHMV